MNPRHSRATPIQKSMMISTMHQRGSNISLQLSRHHRPFIPVPDLLFLHEVDLNNGPPVQGAVAVKTNAQVVPVAEDETLERAHRQPAGIDLQDGTIDAITAAPIPIEEMRATSSRR